MAGNAAEPVETMCRDAACPGSHAAAATRTRGLQEILKADTDVSFGAFNYLLQLAGEEPIGLLDSCDCIAPPAR